MSYIELIEALEKDNTSGASHILSQGINILKGLSAEKRDTKTLREDIEIIAYRLLKTFPSIVPLFHLFNRIFLHLEKTSTGVECILDELEKERINAKEKIITNAQDILQDKKRLLTLSNSSLVREAVIERTKRDKTLRVFCLESRPMREGVSFAQALSSQGIDVTLIIDIAFLEILEDTDIVITGTDGILKRGFINKIGTHPVAILSREKRIPFYVLSPEDRIVPPAFDEFIETSRRYNPSEILDTPGEIDVVNIYFDITPYRYVTGIVKEDGIFKHSEIVFDSIPVAETFVEFLKRNIKELGGYYARNR